MTQCCHHWIIPITSGATSTGTCKICGITRQFFNYIPDKIMKGGAKGKNSKEWRELGTITGNIETLDGGKAQ